MAPVVICLPERLGVKLSHASASHHGRGSALVHGQSGAVGPGTCPAQRWGMVHRHRRDAGWQGGRWAASVFMLYFSK